MSNSSDQFQKLAKRYKETRGVRALVQLIPSVGGAVDQLIMDNWERIKQDRARTFFDELAKGDAILSEELIQTEDFLHAYFATTSAAFRSRQREKIRYFARLLLAGASRESSLKLDDEYEDLLGILSELTYREICLLSILLKYEKQSSRCDYQTERIWTSIFWNDFVEEVHAQLKIHPNEIDYNLTRIIRTGTFVSYRNFGDSYFDESDARGKLTPIFYRLAEYAQINNILQ